MAILPSSSLFLTYFPSLDPQLQLILSLLPFLLRQPIKVVSQFKVSFINRLVAVHNSDSSDVKHQSLLIGIGTFKIIIQGGENKDKIFLRLVSCECSMNPILSSEKKYNVTGVLLTKEKNACFSSNSDFMTQILKQPLYPGMQSNGNPM